MKKLIRIDHNGTKYYEELIPCPRCSRGNKSNGIYYTGVCNGELIPSHVDAGICFQCNGSGVFLEKTKEYTPEHEAELQKAREKREAKRRAEAQARADERNLAWLRKEDFSDDGFVWIILGDTFSIKEELKELGCRFNGLLGWHSSRELSEYPTAKLTADDCFDRNIDGFYFWKSYSDVVDLCNAKRDEFKKLNSPDFPDSHHVGSVGEKIEITATFTAEHSFETHFNYHSITNYIYTFTDETGNVFIWKTTSIIWDEDAKGHQRALETGSKVRIKGTIKAHGEYRGIKQTELIRCKIMKEA